jgi:hypothetical protein
MFELCLPVLIVVVVIIGILVGIIALVRSLNKRPLRHGEVAGISEAPSPDSYVFQKDPTSLTKFLRTMLWIYLCIVIVSLLSDVMQMNLLNSTPFSQTETEAKDLRPRIIGGLYFAIFVVTGILFLKWIHRANTNSRGFGARNMMFTPGWSIGYYFIPFLNLYRPYQAMKEIWKISNNPAAWQNESGSPLLGWWWVSWIISIVLGQISFRMSLAANTVDSLKESTVMSIISAIVDIPLCIVGVSLVSAIFTQQKRLTEMKSYHSVTPT